MVRSLGGAGSGGYDGGMTTNENATGSEHTNRPGKTRTWWHPLLVRLLKQELDRAYTVLDEVPVGKMPLRVDILLIRREDGQLSPTAERDLGVLLSLLNRYTLVEFKGPTDALEAGDLGQLVGCAFLWQSQQADLVPPAEMTLIVLAPRFTRACREEVRLQGWRAEEQERGVYRIRGAPWTSWLVETDAMAEVGQPLLSLVSHVLLADRARIMERLKGSGRVSLLTYALQQIQQFRTLGEDFAMQHTDTEHLSELEEEIRTAVLEAIPPEDRLRGLSPEDVLRGIPPEERLKGLTADELARLRELLDRKRDA